MPSDGFYVELVDQEEKWLATYTYNADGEITASLGENQQDSYTVYNWKKDDDNKTIECEADAFGELNSNTTLYVKIPISPYTISWVHPSHMEVQQVVFLLQTYGSG